MLYIKPGEYIEINNIKYIINLDKNNAYITRLKQKLREENVPIDNIGKNAKKTILLLKDSKAVLSDIHSNTIHQRILNNEVKSLDFLNISYNNYLPINNILAIVAYESEPVLAIVQDMKKRNSLKLFDFTSVRETKTAIFTINGEVVLSAIEAETLINKANKMKKVFIKIGFNNYLNKEHIHSITNREQHHIKEKIKALKKIDFKRVLQLAKKEIPKTAIFCTNNFIILSKVKPQTITNKCIDISYKEENEDIEIINTDSIENTNDNAESEE